MPEPKPPKKSDSPTAIEWGIIIAITAAVIISALGTFGIINRHLTAPVPVSIEKSIPIGNGK